MSIVVHSSVLVAALLDSGPHGIWAEQMLAGGSLHAPELVHAEVTDIFRRLEREKVITASEANAAHEDLMQLYINVYSFEHYASRVWELRHTLASHDASYVAVAEALGIPLVTLDTRLSRSKGPACGFLVHRKL